MYLPQHPVHYVFGMPTHAPLVIKAWMNEPIELKLKLVAWYVSFFFTVGLVASGYKTGLDLASIVVFTTLMLSLPAAILDPSDVDLIPSISNSFFNGILSFHGFILLYLSLHAFVNAGAIYFGMWTLELSNALLSICLGLMIGFSLQQAVAANKRIPWMIVPIFSIAASSLVFYFTKGVIPEVPL